LGTAAGPDAAARAVLSAFGGRLDVLVNNAGTLLRKDSHTVTVEELDLLWQANVRSALLLTAAVLPAMVARRAGSIVSISSISGLRGAPRRSIYAATKAALAGMTRALAMQYGPQGIRANSVQAGVTGAGSGFGEAVATRFAREGARVVGAEVNEENGRRVASAIAREGGAARFFRADVSRSADVKAMIDDAVSGFGGLDILVNNA